MSWTSHELLGMRLDYVTPEHASAVLIERARTGAGGYCCVPNVHMCIEAVDDPAFRDIVNGAVLTWSDSTVLEKARSIRHKVAMLPVIRGADLMRLLLAAAAHSHVPVGLYGASEATIATLKGKLPVEFPGLELAFALSPPFRPLSAEDDATITAEIASSGVRLLLVGLGCPKQERWMAEHSERLPGVTMAGIGAAFDFNAGTVKPSPSWVHKYGFEWLYRLASEPRRLAHRYLTTSPRFLLLVGWDTIRSRLGA